MFLSDLRDATRTLLKQPRFLVIASLTLALGIGAVTSIFSVVNGVLLTPLPYPRPDRLVNVSSSAPGLGYDRFGMSPDLFFFYKRHNTVFEEMALTQGTRVNITESGSPEVADAALTTSGYFPTLGVSLSRGRSFSATEDKPDGPRVAVLSHRLWARRYGSDPGLVGRTIRIDGQPTEVLGIAPATLDAANTPDVWLPSRIDSQNPTIGAFTWTAIARLKPAIRYEHAASNLEPLVQRAMTDYIQSENYRAFLRNGRFRPTVTDMKEDIIGSVREPLWILLGTVTMVLLVACGNVANLCLIRADSRQREIAVRTALGAARAGLIRKLLIEAFVLAAIGAVLGVLMSALALPVLLRLAPGTIPRLEEVRVNGTVLLFAAGAAAISALIFGLVPAIRYTRPQMLTMLRHGGRSATDHPSRQRGRQLLVIAQTAMALVLLVGSGLLARSFARLMNADEGFTTENVLTFRIAFPSTAFPKPGDSVQRARQIVDRLAELPGVEAAGATSELPMAQSTPGMPHEFEGQPVEAGRLPPIVHYTNVTPGFFKALGIPMLRGSEFDSGDLRENMRNVLVNQAAADKHWPGQDAVGKRFRGARSTNDWYVVKGIVGDVRHDGLRQPVRPLIYFPLNVRDDIAPRALTFVLRGPGAESQGDAVRRAVWSVNPELPIASMRTMKTVVEASIMQFTFTMLTLGIAALIALLLGAVGLYGVQSYAVSLRTREIGVRMALGAQPSRVRRSVVMHAALVTAIGLAIGALGAAGLTRFLRGLLYETRPLDPTTFAGMSVLLFVVGLLASYLPARRAAAVSPIEAMKD